MGGSKNNGEETKEKKLKKSFNTQVLLHFQTLRHNLMKFSCNKVFLRSKVTLNKVPLLSN